MNLGRQATAGASQRLPGAVIGRIRVLRPSPRCPHPPGRGPPRRTPPQAGVGPPPRADGHAPPWSPPLPPTPGADPPQRVDHSRGAARRGSWPTFHPLTSADAGCTRSSNDRTRPADPATASPTGSATTPRRSPPDDRPTVHPDAASGRAAAAPAAPTPHQSDHDDPASGRSTASHPQRSAGHALDPADRSPQTKPATKHARRDGAKPD